MDPGWSRLSLRRHVPADFLWPPFSLFRQSRQPAAKTSLPAGSKSQPSHTQLVLVLAAESIFSLNWMGDIHLQSNIGPYCFGFNSIFGNT